MPWMGASALFVVATKPIQRPRASPLTFKFATVSSLAVARHWQRDRANSLRSSRPTPSPPACLWRFALAGQARAFADAWAAFEASNVTNGDRDANVLPALIRVGPGAFGVRVRVLLGPGSTSYASLA